MPSTKKNKQKSKKAKPHVSVEQLVEAADQAADPEQALHIFEAALQSTQDPSVRVDIHEKRAAIHVSLQQIDEAMKDYENALALVKDPERQAGLFMYMGQLSQGEEALAFYRQAIEQLEKMDDRRQLATIYCTAAELYLTDLCFADDAEQQCETYLQQALQIASDLPDALQTCASLRLSQRRQADAVEMILKAFESMKEGCQALAKLVGLREDPTAEQRAVELVHVENVQSLPEFEFRCETAKILLECASLEQKPGECIQAAIDVLGSLLAENDEVVEVWALTGDAFAALMNAELAKHYWERALEMLTTVQKSLEEQQELGIVDDDDEEELNQELEEVLCQIEAVKSKLENLGPETSMED